ncbi:hypothetical protein QZH41_015250, partial [Actinostola sp. cb2023]
MFIFLFIYLLAMYSIYQSSKTTLQSLEIYKTLQRNTALNLFLSLLYISVDNHDVKQEESMMSCSHANKSVNNGDLSNCYQFYHVLSAPTAPGKKMGEDTLTYLNQGQSYLINLKNYGDLSRFEGSLIHSKVKLTFYERKLQIQEAEKFEEWRNNRPLERILEIDVPMSTGIHNIIGEGNQSNSYAFEWNPKNETNIYVIVSYVLFICSFFQINCVSTEFTKGKSGKCIDNSKSKGGDRKHKNEMQKFENKSQDEIVQYQVSSDFTVLIEKAVVKEAEDEAWMSPKQGASPRSVTTSTPVTSPVSTSLLSNHSIDSPSQDTSSTMAT